MRAIIVGATILCVTLSGKTFSAQGLRSAPASPPQIWESCEQMHDDYVRRFESAVGFGMSRMIRPAMRDRTGTLEDGRHKYNLDSVELVGRLQLGTPAVYVPGGHDPSILSSFGSRDLTGFEQTAVAALRRGKELVAQDDDGSGAIACVGAVRAKAECLKCHAQRQAGDLLGAFTYRLRRISGE